MKVSIEVDAKKKNDLHQHLRKLAIYGEPVVMMLGRFLHITRHMTQNREQGELVTLFELED